MQDPELSFTSMFSHSGTGTRSFPHNGFSTFTVLAWNLPGKFPPQSEAQAVPIVWNNPDMTIMSLGRPNEQRKIEKLLVKLAKIKAISAKPVPIANPSTAR
jgi:hypothetical protein